MWKDLIKGIQSPIMYPDTANTSDEALRKVLWRIGEQLDSELVKVPGKGYRLTTKWHILKVSARNVKTRLRSRRKSSL